MAATTPEFKPDPNHGEKPGNKEYQDLRDRLDDYSSRHYPDAVLTDFKQTEPTEYTVLNNDLGSPEFKQALQNLDKTLDSYLADRLIVHLNQIGFTDVHWKIFLAQELADGSSHTNHVKKLQAMGPTLAEVAKGLSGAYPVYQNNGLIDWLNSLTKEQVPNVTYIPDSMAAKPKISFDDDEPLLTDLDAVEGIRLGLLVSKDGETAPAPGYTWADCTSEDNYAVVRYSDLRAGIDAGRLPDPISSEAGITLGLLVQNGTKVEPAEGYKFAHPDSANNYAVVAKDDAEKGQRVRADVQATLRAKAQENPTQYVEGDKLVSAKFNAAPGSNADKYVRIENLYSTDAERALTLTSDRFANLAFKYNPEGKNAKGEAAPSFYEWDGTNFGPQRLVIRGGDTITNKVDAPQVVAEVTPAAPVEGAPVVPSIEDAAKLLAAQEAKLAATVVGSIHTLSEFAEGRVKFLTGGPTDTTEPKTRASHPAEWKVVNDAYIGIRDLYASVDVHKAPKETPYLPEILALEEQMPGRLAALEVKDSKGVLVTMAAPQPPVLAAKPA